MKYFVKVAGEEHVVELVDRVGGAPGTFEVLFDGRPVEVVEREIDALGQSLLLVDGASFGLSVEAAGAGDSRRVSVTLAGHVWDVAIEDERERAAHAAEREAGLGGGVIESVMPGVVVSVLVEEGAAVEAGQPLVVLEAMKMQNEIAAPQAGIVAALHVAPGQPVSAGAKLVTLAAPADA